MKKRISHRDDKPVWVFLQTTSNITAERQECHPIWHWLKNEYSAEGNDSIDKAMISIINSILTQKLKYLTLSKRGVIRLMKQDKEHLQPIEVFSDRMYPKLLSSLYYNGFIKKILNSTTKTASGFEVIDADILSYLATQNIDEVKQLNEVSMLNNGTTYGTTYGTTQGTTYGTKHLNIIASKHLNNLATQQHRENNIKKLFFTLVINKIITEMAGSDSMTQQMNGYLEQLSTSDLSQEQITNLKGICNTYDIEIYGLKQQAEDMYTY